MINHDFFNAIEELCEERDLDKEEILNLVEKGLVNAYKKEYNKPNAGVRFNEEKGEIFLYEYYDVVSEEELDSDDPSKVTLEKAKQIRRTARLGDHLEIKLNINPKDFGRIAINSTKQIFNQGIKNLERKKSYDYFIQHVDEMIIGTVSNITENTVYFDLGYDVSATIPKIELPREECHVGARVKLYLSKVEDTTKGPRVFVSRSDKNLVKRLFEDFIPEIKDGTIEIIGIARDTGDRTKVCVKSNNPDVDALGSCLGTKGTRVKDIINALGGEKIDIYEWSDDPKQLVINALTPAEVIGVQFNQMEKQAIAIVPNDQFSLAIGKRGQNVRLAVQSSGWKIDIKNVDQAQAEDIDF